MAKRFMLLCWMLVGAVMLALTPSPSFATCATTQPLLHSFGGFIDNCPDLKPVAAYAYVVTNAAINSGPVTNFVCETGGEPTDQLVPCQPEAGTPGDNVITVQLDWGGPNLANGALCPNTSGVAGDGRNVMQIVANDGSSLLLSVGYESGSGQFIVEAAHRVDATGNMLPLSCSHTGGRPRVASVTGDSFCFVPVAPPIFSDCDPESLGILGGFGTCPGQAPTSAPGRLYTRTGECGSSPDARLGSGWTLATTTAGAGGSQCLTFPKTTIPTGSCGFVGATGTIGGTETVATVGAVQIGGPLDAADRAIDVRAEQAGGKVKVTFRTTTELMVAGFNVLTSGGRKVNTNLIPAKGINGAGASYEAAIGRGEFRGDKALYVQSVLSDGITTINSDTTSF